MTTNLEQTASTPIVAAANLSPMTEHDLLEVVEIEQTSGLSPWGWDAYHRELQSSDRGLMWVARLDANLDNAHTVAGYVVGRMIVDELHINNIAVRQPYRRSGLATALLAKVLEAAKGYKAVRAFLEVRDGNSAALALYERSGFTTIGRRRNYYSNPPEDALIMTLEIGESA
jgi:ribosomal-protein-alanine N-acetyltransferase